MQTTWQIVCDRVLAANDRRQLEINCSVANYQNSRQFKCKQTGGSKWASSSVEEVYQKNICTSSSSVNPKKSLNNPSITHSLGKNILLANYAADDEVQRLIELIIQPNKTKIQKLPAPWREKLPTMCLNNNGHIYRDDRLKDPEALRTALQRSFP